ncbi:hypothetical protein [Pseudomonas sp. BF-R-30]|uniref:hypothetical protein n=1 Tax=Pseudomonas sp. BF-R-30 TaxID=2832384 RepID=UPI001CC0DAA1|nr:hypothetical protein [Pseudomonas sp. BF-R-30]
MVNRRQLLKLSALGTASFAAPLAYSASNITMAYNTGSSVGSTSPKDLSDNARNLDFLVNGGDASYLDRKGVPRKSWKGMELEHGTAQGRRESEFDEAQDYRKDQFATLLDASGYEEAIAYAPGILLDRTTKTVRYLGDEYRVKSQFLPLTTSDWATDSAKLKLIGDDSLRQDLLKPGGPLNAPYIITGRANIRNPYWGAPTIDPNDPDAGAANSAAINFMLSSVNSRAELDDVTRAINSSLLLPDTLELFGPGRGAEGVLWTGGDIPIIARANYTDLNAAGPSNLRIRDLRITDLVANRSANWAIDLTNGNSNGLFNCHLDFSVGSVRPAKNGVAFGKARGGTYDGTTFVAALIDTRIVNGTVLLNTTDWTIGGDTQIWSLGRDYSVMASGGGTIAPGVQIVPGRDGGLYLFNDLGHNIGTLSVQGVFFDGNNDSANFTGWGIRSAPGIGIVQSIISNNRFWRLNLGGVNVSKLYSSQLAGNMFDNCDSDDTGESDIDIPDIYGCNVNNTHFRDAVAPKTGVARTHTTQPPVVLIGKAGFPTSTIAGEVGFDTVYGNADITNRDSFHEMLGSFKMELSLTTLPNTASFKNKVVTVAGVQWFSDGAVWHQVSANRPSVSTGDFTAETTKSRKVYIPDIANWLNPPPGVAGTCTLDTEFVASAYTVLTVRQLSTGSVHTCWFNAGVWQPWRTNSPT